MRFLTNPCGVYDDDVLLKSVFYMQLFVYIFQTHAALNAQMGVCALVTTSARVHMGTVDPIVKTKRALCVAKMVEFAQCQIISANAEMDTTEQDAIKSNYNATQLCKKFL